jgi:hypothetical protein
MPKKIKETKCTCTICGETWFYGKKDVTENTQDKTACCSGLGCIPAKQKDLDKCPKCGSRAVKKEEVIHEI